MKSQSRQDFADIQRQIRFLTFVFAVLMTAIQLDPANALGQGSAEDYQRWENYRQRTNGLVFRDQVQLNWFGNDDSLAWYKVRIGKGQHRYVLVDAKNGARRDAFDHQLLAKRLTQESNSPVRPDSIDLKEFSVSDDGAKCWFRFAKKQWQYSVASNELTEATRAREDSSAGGLKPQPVIRRSVDRSEDPVPIHFDNRLDEAIEVFWVPSAGREVSYGMAEAGKIFEMSSYTGHAFVLRRKDETPVACFVAAPGNKTAIIDEETPAPKRQRRRRSPNARSHMSPDGKYEVVFADSNVQLIQKASGKTLMETSDGNDDFQYAGGVWWSPTSKHFVVLKTKIAPPRQISMIEGAPRDSIHSRVQTINYRKPGDELDRPTPVLFSVDATQPTVIDDKLFPNPYSMNRYRWNLAGSEFQFIYNQRGHQVVRLIAIDADSGNARVIAEEKSDTFVCYSSKLYSHAVDDEKLIWMSERSGWTHLYMVDQVTGKVDHPITKGDWVVREVQQVDEENQHLYLTVSGIDPDQDPYYRHLVRVNFDGQNLVRLTRGDGDHRWEFSPNRKYIVDTYSRVDLPPVTELRDASDGELICELERADASQLLATGWQPPERFVAKARDGITDIYGVIVRPTHFDAKKRYPVLENIYAGPHSAFVPKSFGRHTGLYEMAELGFIVVKIDGMGTNHRGKAFHDVCWKNLADAGFPDRIAWMKAAAKTRPEMDLSRVGIWGGSAGGQSAMRALIAHNDFYDAAVADCGCHDNRVDKIWWNEQWMGWPIGKHYEQQSNVTQAHRVKGDLMLIWGELDRNVDPASTVQVVDALIKADIDFTQLMVPSAGHGAAGNPFAKRQQADFFVRKLWKRTPRYRRDAGTTDLHVANTPTRDLMLDLFLPEKVSNPPLVVFIHGGGWQNGSYKGCKMKWLTDEGFAVASIGYRLTDEAVFPAQIHDCKAAVRWLRSRASIYGFDASRIAVAGTSAGGHLAALMGTSGDVPELEGSVGNDSHVSSRVQAVVDFYGATDFVLRSKTQPHRANEPGSVVHKLLGGGADKKIELAKLASAVTHISSDDPPMLVLHGERDKTVLIDQSERIEAAYREAGLDIEFRRLPEAGHGGAEFMKGGNRKAIVDFLNRTLR